MRQQFTAIDIHQQCCTKVTETDSQQSAFVPNQTQTTWTETTDAVWIKNYA